MKKFLLIIAAATAGFLPQLAFCDPSGLREAALAGQLLAAKMDDPFMDVEAAAQSALPVAQPGQIGGYHTVTLPCGLTKLVPDGMDKVYGFQAPGQAAGDYPAL